MVMHVEAIRSYCLLKKGVTESFPFNETVLVFKVMNKMFLLTDLDHPDAVNVKCDPEYAVTLREQHSEIVPGYHLNKKYWNKVYIDSGLSEKLILSLIDHSYEEVIKGLPVRQRTELRQL
jgi:predicted DNA-binding protein (MmcQ/YjbR family)